MTRARPALWHSIVDVAVPVLLVLLALVPLQPAFGEAAFWLASAGGVLLGTGVALLGARLRGGALEVAALVVLAYFLFGGLFALRTDALFGIVPSLTTLRDLAVGLVFVWKQLLTVSAPVVGFDHLLAVPYVLGLVSSVLAVSLALRLRRFGWVLVPAGALLAFSIAFGTDDALSPTLVGGLSAVLGLGWASWRRNRARTDAAQTELISAQGTARGALLQRVGVGGLVLVVAAGAGMATATATPGGQRSVLRDIVVPPLELHDYPSPLMSFRKYVTDGAADNPGTLFTVEGEGLQTGVSIRLATMDLYDGLVYKVSGAGGAGSGVFSRVGNRVTDAPEGDPVTLRVQVGSLSGVWAPGAGYLAGVQFEGPRAESLAQGLHYNRATGGLVVVDGLQQGDAYTLQATVPRRPTDQEIRQAKVSAIRTPAPQRRPDAAVVDRLGDILDGTEPLIDQVVEVEAYLVEEGFFSHGLDGQAASRSGHTNERITYLLGRKQMVGDDEQYAVAMALMLAESGIPVRVVMGFDLAADEINPSGPTAVTGAHAHVWVEVPLDGYGWVRFWPTPPEEKGPQEEIDKTRAKPRPDVPQPPLPPQEPAELPPEPPPAEVVEEEVEADQSWVYRLLLIGGGSLAGLLVVLGPGLVMLALKARRSKRRRLAATTSARVSGGWDELVDAATDLGLRLPPVSTRREHAAELAATYPDAGLLPLACRADVAVFGEGQPSQDEVDAYWADVATARRRVTANAGLGMTLRKFFAPASLIGRGRG